MRRTVRWTTVVMLVVASAFWPSLARAQRHGGGRHSAVFVGGYFYDPFFGPYPWWPEYAYPYGYAPLYGERAELRLLVTPKRASVYVDGFYAGVVDDYDGLFQRLPVSPGEHELVLYEAGFRTVHQRLYVSRGATLKITYAMERLGAGETSEAPPTAPPVPPPPPGSAVVPRTPPGGPFPPGALPPRAPEPPDARRSAGPTGFGTLAIRVQPTDAEILIDGDRWTASDGGERLMVQVGEGGHRVDIRKDGYRPFSSDVNVRAGETTPLNVSLSREDRR